MLSRHTECLPWPDKEGDKGNKIKGGTFPIGSLPKEEPLGETKEGGGAAIGTMCWCPPPPSQTIVAVFAPERSKI